MMLYSMSETKHGSCKRTREEQGQEERGWQRKSPFPLSCASTSCVGRKSLIGFAMISYLAAIGFHPHKQRYFEPAANGRKMKEPPPHLTHTHAHTPVLIITVENIHTPTQPVQQETLLHETNKHFLCVLGPIHRVSPIKIQCPAHCIIITTVQQTLLLIC